MVTESKPKCKLIGEDGNVFNLLGKAGKALRRAGMADKATEMFKKVEACQSYDEALCLIQEYVDVE